MKPLHECFQDELTRRTGIDPEAALPAWIRAGLGKGGLFSQARLLHSIRSGPVDLRGARLRNLHFSRLALENVDLTGSILHNVSFEEVHLEASSFQNAVLDSVSFQECELSGATFENAQMEYATWEQVRAHNVTFTNASIHPMWDRCDLSHCEFQGVLFRGGYLLQSRFSHSHLQGTQFLYAQDEAVFLSGMDFSHAQMNYLDLSECASKTQEEGGYAWLHGTSFVGAQLRQVDFNSTDCSHCNFEGADLEGADFFDAHLHKANFHKANLAGARLAFAKVDGAVFEEAELTGADLGSHKHEVFAGAFWTERTDFVDSQAVQERRERRSQESLELKLPSSDCSRWLWRTRQRRKDPDDSVRS